jgi:hypothetical protein
VFLLTSFPILERRGRHRPDALQRTGPPRGTGAEPGGEGRAGRHIGRTAQDGRP